MTYDYSTKPRIIDEEALPAGVFPGTSKLTFDALFFEEQAAHLRGLRLQLTLAELRRLAGVKSLNTVASHLTYFRGLSLVTVSPGTPGDHRGNFYAINLDRMPDAIAAARHSRPRLTRKALTNP